MISLTNGVDFLITAAVLYHVTAKPQVVYRTVLLIVNYKITVKSALSLKGGHLRQIRELKI